MDELEAGSHTISITVTPTPDWLGAVSVHTHDADGGVSTIHLHPHEAAIMGRMLVQFGVILDTLNERLADKTPEARKEIMEMEALMMAPASEDSPFDPPV